MHSVTPLLSIDTGIHDENGRSVQPTAYDQQRSLPPWKEEGFFVDHRQWAWLTIRSTLGGTHVEEPMVKVDLACALADIVLPTFGTIVVNAIATLAQLCQSVYEYKEMCLALHQRYEKLWEAMETMEKEGNLPKSKVLPQFCEAMGQFKLFLDDHQEKKWLRRMAAHRSVMAKIADFNKKIDVMLQVLDIDFKAEMLRWRSESKQAQKNLLELFQGMADDTRMLGDALREGGLEESLMLMKYESLNRRDQNVPEHLQLVENTFHKVMYMAKEEVNLPPVEKWFLSPDDINYKLEKMEDGTFGKISRGTYMGGTAIVIKFLSIESEQDRVQFFKEAGVWYNLNHQHILRLYAVCQVSTPAMFVCDDASNGNFAKYFEIKENRDSMWKLFFEASLGLIYLQGQHKLVHGNLKCNNLLVGADRMAKVSDFKFAFQRNNIRKLSKKLQSEELRWKAPECIRGDEENPILKSDVYSFGMCIIEAWTGKVPFDGDTDKTITDAAFEMTPVNRPLDMNDKAWSLVKRMTESHPSHRIEMAEVSIELKKLADEEAEGKVKKLADEEAKNAQIECSSCSFTNSALANFCSNCGASRDPTVNPPNAQVVELGTQLDELSALCESTNTNQLLCLHVAGRFKEIWTTLKLDENQSSSGDNDIVSDSLELVAAYREFLENLLINQENFVEQLMMERIVVEQLELFHQRIDILVERMMISESGDSWKLQWNQHHDATVNILLTRVSSTNNLLDQVIDYEATLNQLNTEIRVCHGHKHLPVLQLTHDSILELLNKWYLIEITVVRATDLAAADRNGLSDPYVKLRIGKDTHETDRVKKNLNPVWPERRFPFIVNRRKPGNLEVEVWDRDIFTSDDHIGKLCVPLHPIFLAAHSSEQEMEYDLTVPKEYAYQNRQSKLYLKIAVSEHVP